MGKSYLYPGRNTKTFTAAELQLERAYDELDTRGHRLTPAQFFQTPQAMELLDMYYGSLSDRVPPGSQIVSETPGKLTYRDAEGYEHNLIRKPDGTFSSTTDRPSILPNKGLQDTLAGLQSRLQQGFDPLQLAQLDPETQKLFEAQNASEQAQLQNQADIERGKLIAGLYGNNVEHSSIANQAGANFAEGLGRLQLQQKADYANRLLQARQYLTSAGLQQNQDLQNLFATLSGQSNQRDIASAGLGLNQQELEQNANQFAKNFGLNQVGLQQQQQQIDAANSPFNKFLKTLSAAGALGQGVGGLFAGLNYGKTRRT